MRCRARTSQRLAAIAIDHSTTTLTLLAAAGSGLGLERSTATGRPLRLRLPHFISRTCGLAHGTPQSPQAGESLVSKRHAHTIPRVAGRGQTTSCIRATAMYAHGPVTRLDLVRRQMHNTPSSLDSTLCSRSPHALRRAYAAATHAHSSSASTGVMPVAECPPLRRRPTQPH